MKPIIKLAIGAILTGVGLVVSFAAQKEMLAERECTDCDDEVETPVAPLDEDIESFVRDGDDD